MDGKRGRGSLEKKVRSYKRRYENNVFMRRMLKIVIRGSCGPGWPAQNSWERRRRKKRRLIGENVIL